MHIKVVDGVPTPYTITKLRKDNPQVSFPKAIPEATLAEYGVFLVARGERPDYDPETQSVSGGAITEVDGVWTQEWVVSSLDESVVAEQVRKKRNGLLSDSDWTQVADAPVDQAAWAVYRQALRDITDQEGFPYSVNWPTAP